MQTTNNSIQPKQNKQAIDKAIEKVKNELKDPDIRAVFIRLKNK